MYIVVADSSVVNASILVDESERTCKRGYVDSISIVGIIYFMELLGFVILPRFYEA